MKSPARTAIFALLTTNLWAQPYAGSIYGVYPEGVLINQSGGAILVPSQYATFQMNGIQIQYSQLSPGQNVQVFLPQQYMPQVTRVSDPYAWQTKYHPEHPHGGPPGLMKQHGNGRGRGHH
ncbi:hypothetical protein JST97_07695 [bacterium]|nr:hypothetical protein [bacterium]